MLDRLVDGVRILERGLGVQELVVRLDLHVCGRGGGGAAARTRLAGSERADDLDVDECGPVGIEHTVVRAALLRETEGGSALLGRVADELRGSLVVAGGGVLLHLGEDEEHRHHVHGDLLENLLPALVGEVSGAGGVL